MNIKHILVAAIAAMFTASCMTLAVKMMDLDDKNATVITFSNNDKTVAFIPMKHIGPKEFYADVKHILDSLHAEGYVAYLESTRITDSLTAQQKETISLKLRKMLGVHLGKSGYLDTVNNRLMGRKFSNKMKLINQPPYKKMGSDSLKDRIVDVPMNRIVKAYEDKYGPLYLNDCDYVLKPEDKYECGKEPGNQVSTIILGYRERHLANSIMDDNNKKIAVIYGALHKDGLFRELRAIDSTWNFKL